MKKRQKEMQRKERQAEKLSKRDERRLRRNDPTQPAEGVPEEGLALAPADSPPDAALDAAALDRPAPARRASHVFEGSIKRLTDKGFGFIETESGDDLFFHWSVVQGVAFDQLQVGQRVEFAEGRGPKGLRADAVRPL